MYQTLWISYQLLFSNNNSKWLKRSACLALMIPRTLILQEGQFLFSCSFKLSDFGNEFSNCFTLLFMVIIYYHLDPYYRKRCQSDRGSTFVLSWFISRSSLPLNWPNDRFFWDFFFYHNIQNGSLASDTFLLGFESRMIGRSTPDQILCIRRYRYFVWTIVDIMNLYTSTVCS